MTKQTLNTKIQQRIPVNTTKNTNYAVRTWNTWASARNEAIISTRLQGTLVPLADRFREVSEPELDEAIAFFVQEVCKADGDPYVPDTLRGLVAGLQRYMREDLGLNVHLLQKNSATFPQMQKALEARCRELTKEGVGVIKRQAQPISEAQERKLWETGTLGFQSSVQLQRTTYFYVSKCFGLRSAHEHRNLMREQLYFGQDAEGHYVEFLGHAAKNFQGGQNQRYVHDKTNRQYHDPANGICAYNIIKAYCEYIPDSGIFYRQPLPGNMIANIRYGKNPVGVNTLSKCVSQMMSTIGEEGFYTGHSIKATCGTQLFDEGTDEQLIQHRTGHRSVTSVRRYVSNHTEQQRSKKLDPPPISPTKVASMVAFPSPEVENDSNFSKREINFGHLPPKKRPHLADDESTQNLPDTSDTELNQEQAEINDIMHLAAQLGNEGNMPPSKVYTCTTQENNITKVLSSHNSPPSPCVIQASVSRPCEMPYVHTPKPPTTSGSVCVKKESEDATPEADDIPDIKLKWHSRKKLHKFRTKRKSKPLPQNYEAYTVRFDVKPPPKDNNDTNAKLPTKLTATRLTSKDNEPQTIPLTYETPAPEKKKYKPLSVTDDQWPGPVLAVQMSNIIPKDRNLARLTVLIEQTVEGAYLINFEADVCHTDR